MANYVRTNFLVQPSTGDVALLLKNKTGQITFEIFVKSIVAVWQDGSTVKIKTHSNNKAVVLDFSTPQESLVALQYVNKSIEAIKASLIAVSLPVNLPVNGYFEFHQVLATSSWFVAHNMGTKPSVTITDDSLFEIDGLIRYLDNNHLVVLFNQSVSGWALLG